MKPITIFVVTMILLSSFGFGLIEADEAEKVDEKAQALLNQSMKIIILAIEMDNQGWFNTEVLEKEFKKLEELYSSDLYLKTGRPIDLKNAVDLYNAFFNEKEYFIQRFHEILSRNGWVD